jgi:hypothetical protein
VREVAPIVATQQPLATVVVMPPTGSGPSGDGSGRTGVSLLAGVLVLVAVSLVGLGLASSRRKV